MAAVAASVLIGVQAPAPVAAETPRPGGTLTFAVGAKPPSYDGHRETTFAAIHPVAPHYSTLLRFDPENYPKIVGDVAESWTISGDGFTYTFKIRPGIKFHDGSLLTAQDVKATYEHIISPPEGVVSARKASYAPVEKVEAPNDGTVIFRLKWPSAALLANLASPWNFIHKAELLAKDPHWYETHVMGALGLKPVLEAPHLPHPHPQGRGHLAPDHPACHEGLEQPHPRGFLLTHRECLPWVHGVTFSRNSYGVTFS
jgi:peptide/nickel transport system substrate-binding protein